MLGAATMSLLMHARMGAGGGTGAPHSSAATAAAAAAAAHAQAHAHAHAQAQAQASYLTMANMAALMQHSAPGGALLMPHWAAMAARFMPYGAVPQEDDAGRPSVLCRPKPMKLTADKDAHAALAAMWAGRKSDSGLGAGSAAAANPSGDAGSAGSAAASMSARAEPAESRWGSEPVCC